MPKYWVKNYFAHGRFPEVGQKQKTEKKKKREREKERKRERLNDGDNNGQAIHGAHKHAWRTQAAWANSSILTIVGGLQATIRMHFNLRCLMKNVQKKHAQTAMHLE